jgi:hypothetical protein
VFVNSHHDTKCNWDIFPDMCKQLFNRIYLRKENNCYTLNQYFSTDPFTKILAPFTIWCKYASKTIFCLHISLTRKDKSPIDLFTVSIWRHFITCVGSLILSCTLLLPHIYIVYVYFILRTSTRPHSFLRDIIATRRTKTLVFSTFITMAYIVLVYMFTIIAVLELERQALHITCWENANYMFTEHKGKGLIGWY